MAAASRRASPVNIGSVVAAGRRPRGRRPAPHDTLSVHSIAGMVPPSNGIVLPSHLRAPGQ